MSLLRRSLDENRVDGIYSIRREPNERRHKKFGTSNGYRNSKRMEAMMLKHPGVLGRQIHICLPPLRPTSVSELQVLQLRLESLDVAVSRLEVFVESVALGDELANIT